MKILRDILSSLSKLDKEDLEFTYNNLKSNNKPNFKQKPESKDKNKLVLADAFKQDF